MPTATIEWSGVPGSLGYLFEYKEQTSSVWITPTTPANPTLNLSYPLDIDSDIIYDFRISSNCADGTTKYAFGTLFYEGTPTYGWIGGDYICEQDSPFNLVNTYTGFSSPQSIYWDNTTGLYYVVDVDDVLGNVWAFDPDTITGFSSATHITGANAPVNMLVGSNAFDSVNRKIWTAGETTGGARVLDLASNTWTFLPYGSNGAGGTGTRSPIVLSSSAAYCFSTSPNTIEVFDLVSLAPVTTITKSSIPSSGTYMAQAYGVTFVGAEAWVWAGQRVNGNIAIYDSAFTTLLGTITLPGILTPGSPWSPNPSYYWQSHMYDAVTNRWYVSDTGSNQIIIINTLTKAIVNQISITNLRGKDHASASFFKNELNGEVYAAVRCENTTGDGTLNTKLYRIDDTGVTYVYPNESVTFLRLREGTNEAFGVNPNLVQWQGGAWATDGLVFKYNL